MPEQFEKATGIKLPPRLRNALIAMIASVTVFTGCSDEGKTEGVSAPISATAVEQGGEKTGQQAKLANFNDCEALFVENEESQRVFNDIILAIEYSQQGEVEASAGILRGYGLTQDKLRTAISLEGDMSENTTFLKSYERVAGQPWALTSGLTDAIGQNVIDALPVNGSGDNNSLTVPTSMSAFNIVDQDRLDELTEANIEGARLGLSTLKQRTDLSAKELEAWEAAGNEIVRTNAEMRDKLGLPPVQ